MAKNSAEDLEQLTPLRSVGDRRVRILHVITRLVVGGAQENTLLTVAHLDPAHYCADLACGPGGSSEGSLGDRARQLGIAFVEITNLVREPHPIKDLLAFLQLYLLIRRNRYDIVHTHTTKAGLLGRMAARAAHVPIIVHTPHGHAFHGYLGPTGSRLLVAMERALSRITARIICLTQSEQQDHLRLGVGRADQLAVIHSGVDIQRITAARVDASGKRRELGLPLTCPLVGCVARLVPVKGHETLIRAVPAVLEKVPDATVVLVGDGPQREALRQEVHRLRLERHVRFLGLRGDVPELLALFDVVVVPSLNEGMGKVAVEAMAAGRPVVGSCVVGIQDVVEDGRTGLLVSPGDPRALAHAMIRLLGRPDLREAMGNAARLRATQFDIAKMIVLLSQLYEEMGNLLQRRVANQRVSKISTPNSGTR